MGVSAAALDPTTVLANPGFADLAAGELRAGSAVVDVGDDTGVDRNGSGTGLYNGSAHDLGAFEGL